MFRDIELNVLAREVEDNLLNMPADHTKSEGVACHKQQLPGNPTNALSNDSVLRKSCQPTLTLLANFPMQSGKVINIIERIATSTHNLGINLLSDNDGTITGLIETEYKHELPTRATEAILQRWLQGTGRTPQTWSTLVVVLKEINLNSLAREVNDNLLDTNEQSQQQTQQKLTPDTVQKQTSVASQSRSSTKQSPDQCMKPLRDDEEEFHCESEHKSSEIQLSKDSQQNKPTLPLLQRFPTKPGSVINIIEKIGSRSHELGIRLLTDDFGSTTTNIESQYKHDPPSRATEAIIQKWLQGTGRTPQSWDTLIMVLREIDLNVLAQDIENSLASMHVQSDNSPDQPLPLKHVPGKKQEHTIKRLMGPKSGKAKCLGIAVSVSYNTPVLKQSIAKHWVNGPSVILTPFSHTKFLNTIILGVRG